MRTGPYVEHPKYLIDRFSQACSQVVGDGAANKLTPDSLSQLLLIDNIRVQHGGIRITKKWLYFIGARGKPLSMGDATLAQSSSHVQQCLRCFWC